MFSYITAGDGQAEKGSWTIPHHPGKRVHVQTKVLKPHRRAVKNADSCKNAAATPTSVRGRMSGSASTRAMISHRMMPKAKTST